MKSHHKKKDQAPQKKNQPQKIFMEFNTKNCNNMYNANNSYNSAWSSAFLGANGEFRVFPAPNREFRFFWGANREFRVFC